MWFAVYADLVYHHGAGFRSRVARVDGAPRVDDAVAKALVPSIVGLAGNPYPGRVDDYHDWQSRETPRFVGNAVVLITGDIPAELEAKVRRAEGNCPEHAIRIDG